jgi:hypothetical protein
MPASATPEDERRWTSHPALRAFGFVFLVRDLIVAVLAVGGLAAGGVANHDTLWLVAAGVGVLTLAGVVASSVVGQRRADASMGLPTPVGLPGRRNALRAALRQQPSAQAALRSAIANQVSTGTELKDEMCDAQVKGTWDDDGWAYRKRVDAWTQRTADVLTGGGREDLASALAEVEPPPRPPFEALLKGHSPSYARLVGLLDTRIALLEQSQAETRAGGKLSRHPG